MELLCQRVWAFLRLLIDPSQVCLALSKAGCYLCTTEPLYTISGNRKGCSKETKQKCMVIFANTVYFFTFLNLSIVLFTHVKRAKAQGPWDTSGQWHPWNDLAVRLNVCKIFFFIISLWYWFTKIEWGIATKYPSIPSRYSLVITYFSQNGYLKKICFYISQLFSFI